MATKEASLKSPRCSPLQRRPTLAQLRTHMHHFVTKWEGVAIALDLDSTGNTMALVRKDFIRDGAEVCCMEFLRKWLNRKEQDLVRWDVLLKALEDVELIRAASDIRKSLEDEMKTEQLGITKEPLFLPNEDDSVSTAKCAEQAVNDPSQKYALHPEKKKHIRNYQWELAAPGLSGENYIVNAPTGSGKTQVAAIIISDHLLKTKSSGLVFFLVNKVPLAQQQKNELASLVMGAKFDAITGSTANSCKSALKNVSDSSDGVTAYEKTCDVVVCTDGCLLNSLEQNELSMSQISLIIIDECHNTHKKTPYAKIMYVYLKEMKRGLERLPQIVGLTASLGAGGSSKPELTSTVNHIINLCAMMNATGGIKRVEHNVEELSMHTNKPEFILSSCKTRENEPLFCLIENEMEKLQKVAKFSCSFAKCSQSYETCVVQLKEKQLEENTSDRDLVSTLEMLACLCKTLQVYMDLRYKDAISVLKEQPLLHSNCDAQSPYEQKLSLEIQQLISKLDALPVVENPLLLELKRIVEKQFSLSTNQRGIVFVPTRKHASSVCSYLSSQLDCEVKPLVVTGHSGSLMLRTPVSEQEEAIKKLRDGSCNLLVSTSILEEGLDVPACNLVIRYQYVSNEIAKVQTQGRARAEESCGFTVISSGSEKQYQDLMNDEKLALVAEAMHYIPPGSLLVQKLEKQQVKILKEQQVKESIKKSKVTEGDSYGISLLCKKCKEFACPGSDVYSLTFASAYVVTDEYFEEKFKVKEHPRPAHIPDGMSRTHKLHCANCDHEWGVIGKWTNSQEYPLIKCPQFSFKINGQIQNFKKWKDVPFTPKSKSC